MSSESNVLAIVQDDDALENQQGPGVNRTSDPDQPSPQQLRRLEHNILEFPDTGKNKLRRLYRGLTGLIRSPVQRIQSGYEHLKGAGGTAKTAIINAGERVKEKTVEIGGNLKNRAENTIEQGGMTHRVVARANQIASAVGIHLKGADNVIEIGRGVRLEEKEQRKEAKEARVETGQRGTISSITDYVKERTGLSQEASKTSQHRAEVVKAQNQTVIAKAKLAEAQEKQYGTEIDAVKTLKAREMELKKALRIEIQAKALEYKEVADRVAYFDRQGAESSFASSIYSAIQQVLEVSEETTIEAHQTAIDDLDIIVARTGITSAKKVESAIRDISSPLQVIYADFPQFQMKNQEGFELIEAVKTLPAKFSAEGLSGIEIEKLTESAYQTHLELSKYLNKTVAKLKKRAESAKNSWQIIAQSTSNEFNISDDFREIAEMDASTPSAQAKFLNALSEKEGETNAELSQYLDRTKNALTIFTDPSGIYADFPGGRKRAMKLNRKFEKAETRVLKAKNAPLETKDFERIAGLFNTFQKEHGRSLNGYRITLAGWTESLSSIVDSLPASTTVDDLSLAQVKEKIATAIKAHNSDIMTPEDAINLAKNYREIRELRRNLENVYLSADVQVLDLEKKYFGGKSEEKAGKAKTLKTSATAIWESAIFLLGEKAKDLQTNYPASGTESQQIAYLENTVIPQVEPALIQSLPNGVQTIDEQIKALVIPAGASEADVKATSAQLSLLREQRKTIIESANPPERQVAITRFKTARENLSSLNEQLKKEAKEGPVNSEFTSKFRAVQKAFKAMKVSAQTVDQVRTTQETFAKSLKEVKEFAIAKFGDNPAKLERFGKDLDALFSSEAHEEMLMGHVRDLLRLKEVHGKIPNIEWRTHIQAIRKISSQFNITGREPAIWADYINKCNEYVEPLTFPSSFTALNVSYTLSGEASRLKKRAELFSASLQKLEPPKYNEVSTFRSITRLACLGLGSEERRADGSLKSELERKHDHTSQSLKDRQASLAQKQEKLKNMADGRRKTWLTARIAKLQTKITETEILAKKQEETLKNGSAKGMIQSGLLETRRSAVADFMLHLSPGEFVKKLPIVGTVVNLIPHIDQEQLARYKEAFAGLFSSSERAREIVENTRMSLDDIFNPMEVAYA